MSIKIDKTSKCAVIGYGSWGTAIVKILLENESSVAWHVPNTQISGHLKEFNTNPKYLSSVHFDTSKLFISSSINKVIKSADIVIFATPSAFLEKTLERLKTPLANKFVVSAIKGIVSDKQQTIAEFFHESYGLSFNQIGIVTGPCHAEEVALERLSYLNIVTPDDDNAQVLSAKFTTPYIITNTQTDVYGVEYATVLKNIYAISVGICLGLGYGDNFIAVLIANTMREMARFVTETYPYDRDLNTSPYLGDLLVTSYSQFSRNRSFGVMIGKGYSVKSAQIEMDMIAEGYYASNCIYKINQKKKVDMPIADTVYRILYERANAAKQYKALTLKLK
ncbi:MAG: NAD(P)H-dependent glycerol-3-phosphate dehydrogenase [Rikenellaceae bacterium]